MTTSARIPVGDPVVVDGQKYRVHAQAPDGYELRIFPKKRATHVLIIEAGNCELDKYGIWRVHHPYTLKPAP